MPKQQSYECSVCDRKAFGCRRMKGMQEITEGHPLPKGCTEERVCPTCWIKLKKEFGAQPVKKGMS